VQVAQSCAQIAQSRAIFNKILFVSISCSVAQSCAQIAQSCAIFNNFVYQRQLFFVRKLKTWSVLNVSDIRIVSCWSEMKTFI